MRTIAIGEGLPFGGPVSGFLVNYWVTLVGGAWTSQSTVQPDRVRPGALDTV